MEALAVIDFADKLLALVPQVIAAGGDVLNIIANGRTALAAMKAENRGPTQAEWDALDAQINALMGQLKG
jgi:hypothetical protein